MTLPRFLSRLWIPLAWLAAIAFGLGCWAVLWAVVAWVLL